MDADTRNALRIHTLDDAHRLARRRLPRPVYDYIEGGAGDEITMRANRTSLNAVRFQPSFAVTKGTEPRGLHTSLLGHDVSSPILLGPVGFTRSMHPGGDAAGLAAAEKAGTVFCHSSMSGHSIEQLASPAPANYWFQLYALGGRQGAEQLVTRASHAGCRTLVVTIDTPVPGNRERDLRYGAALPVRVNRRTIRTMAPYVVGRPRWLANAARDHFTLSLANAAGLTRDGVGISEDESLLHWVVEPLTWDDVDWVRANWRGSLVIKGVLTAEDARRALDHGADAVAVSNHGGRQLDQVAPALDALIDVTAAVGERTTILMDGGIRRGSDVAVALAFGARAVLLGRAWVYGLAAAGEKGVTRVLEMMRSDLSRTLQLLGVRDVADLNPDVVSYSPPDRRGDWARPTSSL